MGVDEEDGERGMEENGDDHYLKGAPFAELPVQAAHPCLKPVSAEERRRLGAGYWAPAWMRVMRCIGMIQEVIPPNRRVAEGDRRRLHLRLSLGSSRVHDDDELFGGDGVHQEEEEEGNHR